MNVEARTDGGGQIEEAAAERLADLLQPYDGSGAIREDMLDDELSRLPESTR